MYFHVLYTIVKEFFQNFKFWRQNSKNFVFAPNFEKIQKLVGQSMRGLDNSILLLDKKIGELASKNPNFGSPRPAARWTLTLNFISSQFPRSA
jgi:hypothetical protein